MIELNAFQFMFIVMGAYMFGFLLCIIGTKFDK